jgi:hypothetical protein
MGVLKYAFLVRQEHMVIAEEASWLEEDMLAEVVTAEAMKDFGTAAVAAVVKTVFACIQFVATDACNDDCSVAESELVDLGLEG